VILLGNWASRRCAVCWQADVLKVRVRVGGGVDGVPVLPGRLC
jgi:hypothetical protein